MVEEILEDMEVLGEKMVLPEGVNLNACFDSLVGEKRNLFTV